MKAEIGAFDPGGERVDKLDESGKERVDGNPSLTSLPTDMMYLLRSTPISYEEKTAFDLPKRTGILMIRFVV